MSAPARPTDDPPVTDLSTLPLVLTLDEVARVYRRGVPTIRRDLQAGTFRPAPFAKFPYRWMRDAVEADLRRRSREQGAAKGKRRRRRA